MAKAKKAKKAKIIKIKKVVKMAKKKAPIKKTAKKLVKKVIKKAVKTGVKKAVKKAVVKKSPKKSSKKAMPIPKGYHSITPYLIVDHGMEAIEFYKKAFAAKAVVCMKNDAGKVGHAELTIGDSKVMLADEHLECGACSPQSTNGTPVSIHLYIKDVDAVVERAVAAGAKVIRPTENMFYGDRSCFLQDPFGHKWCVSTHIENVTPKEMKKRMEALMHPKS